MYSNIVKATSATGSILLPNKDFIEQYKIDSTPEWIESMTGIQQRYFVKDISELEEMAIKCAKKLMVECDASEIDGIIVASSTSGYHFPGLSQIVHNALGLKNSARAVDLNSACNGFMVALSFADNWIKHEGMKKVIVIGAEAMSSILDMKDRSTCCLFGDGAGAVLLEASESRGLKAFEHMVLSDRYDTLVAKQCIVMNGRAVFENSVKAFEEMILRVLHKGGKSLEDVDLFVLHQANYRIFQSLAKKMGLNEEKIPFLGKIFANTSAATIPMTLANLDFQSKTIVLAGFGAGFTTTASLLI